MSNSEGGPVRCQNCGWTGTEDQTNELRRSWERVQPGDVMPAGECPECGASAMLAEPAPPTPKPRVKKVCIRCGSEDVVRDAWAGWNPDAQTWELAEWFDHVWCRTCEGASAFVDRPIEEAA